MAVQRKPEQSICTVLPLLQTALKRVALVACTVPYCKPLLMPRAQLAAVVVDTAGPAGAAVTPACSEAPGSLAKGRVTAGACLELPQLALAATTTPCAFSPCSAGPGLHDGGRSSAFARTPTGSSSGRYNRCPCCDRRWRRSPRRSGCCPQRRC
ncbi:hypothetical protein XavaCFBP5823_07495 [Xanthomonas axonopodis pv. vasculorum]|nr:hypothetical protein XavaCFBP5823_07495 [Xanthomonas axonopodis pv. vasculorum]